MFNNELRTCDFTERAEARRQGEIDALREMWKQLYLKYYRLDPPDAYGILEEAIALIKYERRHRFALITMNFKPEVEACEQLRRRAIDHTCALEKRAWVKKVYCMNVEYRNPIKMSGMHTHSVVELKTLYSPAQIARFITSGRGVDLFGSGQSVDVKKVPRHELAKVYKYCRKQGTDLCMPRPLTWIIKEKKDGCTER